MWELNVVLGGFHCVCLNQSWLVRILLRESWKCSMEEELSLLFLQGKVKTVWVNYHPYWTVEHMKIIFSYRWWSSKGDNKFKDRTWALLQLGQGYHKNKHCTAVSCSQLFAGPTSSVWHPFLVYLQRSLRSPLQSKADLPGIRYALQSHWIIVSNWAYGSDASQSVSVAVVTYGSVTKWIYYMLEELLSKRRLTLLWLENTGKSLLLHIASLLRRACELSKFQTDSID